jgi:hypothetical protein
MKQAIISLCLLPVSCKQLTFNGLHGVTSQKIELFITTAVRTSYLTSHPLELQIGTLSSGHLGFIPKVKFEREELTTHPV